MKLFAITGYCIYGYQVKMVTMISLCNSKEEAIGMGLLRIKEEYPEIKGYHGHSVGICQADIKFKEGWTE